MKKREGNRNAPRLSGRNCLETLNDLLHIFNPLLPQEKQLNIVKTPGDLFTLRKKIETLSPINGTGNSVTQQAGSIKKVEVLPKPFIQALSTIATNAWRARNKMVDAENGEVKDEMKRVYRHVEAVFDAMNQIGIEVHDMQSRPYDSGMAFRVVSFEPTPGLSRETITETIKPTIIWQGQFIQVGEVIVGTPQKN